MLRSFFKPAPQIAGDQPPKVLIASEGRQISDDVIDLAARMMRGQQDAEVRVLTVARLWGSSLGFPNPGLRPTKGEMAVQEEIISSAINRLEKLGLEANGTIVTTRNPCRAILKEAKRRGTTAIIMGADPRRKWFGSFLWSQEPYRVSKTSNIPVHLVAPEA
ncbi:MAG: universal stress protein [Methylobacillus sp.]|jgi:nucleotide-binding universal stress UspA family protein|nr:universal stress protein [Methylobacillus sp.]